jgi:prepilin-type N-terminal cleavage/methylation domain-containing protein
MIFDVTNDSGGGKNSLPVEWHECAWCPCIGRRGAVTKMLSAAALPPLTVRHNKLIKLMKNKFSNSRARRAAFTLVELLVVIAIIGILAAMLLPVLKSVRDSANKMKAKTEMSQLVTAITAYDADYSRFPVSPQVQAAANTAGGDFTYGGTITSLGGATSTVQNPVSYGSYQLVNNAEVIAILMDNTQNPVDANHQKNPKQVHYLNAAPAASITSPGVGPDGVYRDPWGNPYIITMDLNYDEMCVDAFYGLKNVSSGGLNGLVQDPNVPGPDNWAFRGKVMVWSAGPNQKIDAGDPATDYENKDNVLSWQ